MKIMITVFCGLGLLIAPLLHAQDDWVFKNPATKPAERNSHAMAPIGDDQVLLFGGEAPGLNNETWVYDLSDNTWTLKNPAPKPSARHHHAMAYIGGDQVLLFGGNNPGHNDETWLYDLSDNTWTLKSPATKPSARYVHAMAYLGGDQVLLFGGFISGQGFKDDTWVYDLSDNTWTLKNPVTKPSGRDSFPMVHIGGDQVLLFGGRTPNANDETWIYDLSDNLWTLQSPATKPPARFDHAMAFLIGDQALIFGGTTRFDELDDTWIYDLSANTWTLQNPATKPSGRFRHAMASLGGGQVLLFGGFHAIPRRDDETWVYSHTVRSNLALNKTAMASSSRPGHPPGDAVDGSTSTHWRSDPVGSAPRIWWRVDLGAVYNIDNVVIDWMGSFYALQYQIQVSFTTAPGSWETVYSDNAGNGGIDNITFPATDARHVRILMTQHNEQVERINEVQVFAASGTLANVSKVEASEVAKSEAITDYVLEQNYPNPFNPTTIISFQLPTKSAVELAIYNMSGQLVKRLVAGELNGGHHSFVWDAKNGRDERVASGVYLYVLIAGEFTAQRKLVLMK